MPRSSGPRPGGTAAPDPESTSAGPAPTPSVPAPPRARSSRRANPTGSAGSVAVVTSVPALVAPPLPAPSVTVVDEAPVPIDRAADPNRGLLDLLANELAATGRRTRSRKAELS